ncbi:MAG: DUF1080 domain-containing protein [Isosphaeraceae bacterium]
MRSFLPGWTFLAALALAVCLPNLATAAEDGWVTLVGPGHELDAWKPPTGDWKVGGGAKLNPENPKRLVVEPGEGVIVNGPTGRTKNLFSKAEFGDLEFRCEFLVPKGSNSGVKFEGLYEIQIADSWGKAKPLANDLGGIYPRAELLPKYHQIDDGFPPLVNASKAPGEWQTLAVTFLAPRFDADGKKTTNARFVKVVLNGKVVQDDVELLYATGHAWHKPEVPKGPIMLQADHGPVAFRKVQVRPLAEPASK